MPFILFDGNCGEAISFYQKCLGGELSITRLGDTPMKDQIPKNLHHKVTYAYLKSGIIELSATDWLHPTRKPVQGNMVAIYITGSSYDELANIFNKLSEGADKNLIDELKEMPFGIYGHLADKYSVHWFFRGEK